MLDIRKLRLLRELHVRGTVVAVADALAYTPSAISQQLAQLQREAGVPLTERVGRRLRLTDAGLRLVGYTDALLAQLEAAEADLQATSGTVRGTLRLASIETPLISLVPIAQRLLAKRHPQLRLELMATEADVLPDIRLGELDACIEEEYEFAPEPLSDQFAKDELGRDEMLVVVPRGHPLAVGTGPISLRDLAGDAWIVPYEETHSARMTVGACHISGFEPDVRHRCNDVLITLALVAGGAGVGLVPRLARPERHDGVVVRPVADHDLHRTIHVFTRRSARHGPAVEALVAALREGAAEHLRLPPA
jgi:DNA-binding transcriptional LysR family regulator